MRINVAIVDDHKLLSQSLCSALSDYKFLEVKIVASHGNELIREISIQNHIDIVLLDEEMPVMDGWETLKVINRKYPNIRTILLSNTKNQSSIIKAFKSGARSFISKCSEMDELVDAIIGVHENGHYFNDSHSQSFFNSIIADVNLPIITNDVLSSREREILELICRGLSTAEIAQKLFISPRTIEVHRRSINTKTNSSSIVHLVLYAVKNGIIRV